MILTDKEDVLHRIAALEQMRDEFACVAAKSRIGGGESAIDPNSHLR